MSLFFFFQAEDGIRDIGVTGVQTCALPILFEIGIGGYDDPNWGGASLRVWRDFFQRGDIHGLDFYERSEERSVGKECRYRWSPYHLKKKRFKLESNCSILPLRYLYDQVTDV